MNDLKIIGLISVVLISTLFASQAFADFGSPTVISSTGRVLEIGNIENYSRPQGTDTLNRTMLVIWTEDDSAFDDEVLFFSVIFNNGSNTTPLEILSTASCTQTGACTGAISTGLATGADNNHRIFDHSIFGAIDPPNVRQRQMGIIVNIEEDLPSNNFLIFGGDAQEEFGQEWDWTSTITATLPYQHMAHADAKKILEGTTRNNAVVIWNTTSSFSTNFGEIQQIVSDDLHGSFEFDTFEIIDANDGTELSREFTQRNLVSAIDLTHLDTGTNDGNVYHVLNAIDDANGDGDIFFIRSTNIGRSYSSPIEIVSNADNQTGVLQNYIFYDHDFAQSANRTGDQDVTILFSTQDAGNTELAQVRSTDGGATWTSQELIEDGTDCEWDAMPFSHYAVQTGDTIHIMCVGAGNLGIKTAHSNDMGSTYTSFTEIHDDPLDTTNTPIIVNAPFENDKFVYYYWNNTDDVSGSLSNGFTYSDDGGNTFKTNQFLNNGTQSISGEIQSFLGSVFLVEENSAGNIQYFFEEFFDTPSAPLSLSTLENVTGSVRLQWITPTTDGGNAINGYSIERDTGSGFEILVANTTNTDTEFIDSTITFDVIHEYKVRALNQAGEILYVGNPRSNISQITPVGLDTEPTSLVVSSNNIVGELTLTWTSSVPSQEILGYQIDRKIGVGGTFLTLVANTNSQDLTFTDSPLEDTTEYCYRLKTITNVGTSTSFSVEDCEFTEEPTPVPVTGGGITSGAGTVGDPPEPEFPQEEFDQALAEAIESLEARDRTPLEQIVQTFFEFTVVDNAHEDLQLNSFLDDKRLGIRWSTGQDIIVTSIVPAPSPFLFSFEQVPVIKRGSNAVVSTNFILYDLLVPLDECIGQVTEDCVQRVRYEIPVTVNAIIEEIQVSDTGTITVDLTEELIDPILLILLATFGIPIVAGLVQRVRGKTAIPPVQDILK